MCLKVEPLGWSLPLQLCCKGFPVWANPLHVLFEGTLPLGHKTTSHFLCCRDGMKRMAHPRDKKRDPYIRCMGEDENGECKSGGKGNPHQLRTGAEGKGLCGIGSMISSNIGWCWLMWQAFIFLHKHGNCWWWVILVCMSGTPHMAYYWHLSTIHAIL